MIALPSFLGKPAMPDPGERCAIIDLRVEREKRQQQSNPQRAVVWVGRMVKRDWNPEPPKAA